MLTQFTLDEARALKQPTDKLLCKLDDNKHIAFGEYKVVDYNSKTVLLHVPKEVNEANTKFALNKERDGSLTMDERILKH